MYHGRRVQVPFPGRRPAGKTSGSRGAARTGLLIGILVTVVFAFFSQFLGDNYLELKLLDYRHRHFSDMPVDPAIVHIDIDDTSLEQLHRWPWPRRYLAQLISLCREAGARQIVLDMILPEENAVELTRADLANVSAFEPVPPIVGEPQVEVADNDRLLAQAMEQAQNVLIPYYAAIQDPAAADAVRDRQRLEYEEVKSLIAADPGAGFEEIYRLLRPGKNIYYRDEEYEALLNSYIYCLSEYYLSPFFTPFSPDAVRTRLPGLGPLTFPIPQLARQVSNSGFATAYIDRDGTARRIPLLAQREGLLHHQLSFAVACRMLGIQEEDIDLSHRRKIRIPRLKLEIPLDENGAMLISWPCGRWEQTGNHYSILLAGKIWMAEKGRQDNQRCLDLMETLKYQFSTVPDREDELDEETKALVQQMRENLQRLGDPNELRAANEKLDRQIEEDKNHLRRVVAGRIVFVGSVATGVPDFVVSPLDKRTPGVVVHANILNTILQGYYLRRPHPLADPFVIILVGAIMSVLTSFYRPLISGLGVILFILLLVWVNFALVFGRWHYWLNVVNPVTVTILTFVAVTFYRQITEGKARRRITARFKQYASPAVVDRIVSSGAAVSLAGEIRPISCYFSDLAGFTTISEKLGPEKTVSVLNIYLDRMTEVLDRHLATINKFQGDGIFSFFGAPIAQPDHSWLACLAALDTQAELLRLVDQQRQSDPEFPPLKMRVGISTGEVVVGDCGSHRRFDYTAIGDTVNLGARLESANKYFGTKSMICQNCYQQSRDAIEARYLGSVRVVGKKQGIGIYELMARAGELDGQTRQWIGLFETAVRHFQQREFDKAADTLSRCLQYRPQDKAALLYQQTIQSLLQTGIPDSFDGCLELTEK